MLSNLKEFFKSHCDDILLFLTIVLLCLLVFGAGMLTQFALEKPPLQIEYPLPKNIQE